MGAPGRMTLKKIARELREKKKLPANYAKEREKKKLPANYAKGRE